MKIYLTILGLAFLYIGCSSNNQKNSSDTLTTDSSGNSSTIDTLCFLHTSGTSNQDSTLVSLIINGDEVTGAMKWFPYEKDSRRGTLEGVQVGNVIKATWSFMQEGVTDTMEMEFELGDGKLAQKPLVVNPNTGREQTDENKDYTIIYNKIKCD